MARTKGSNVVELVRFLRTQKERASELLPPRLHRYLQERIEVSKWYPEEDSLALMRVLAGLLPLPPGGEQDPFEIMGRFAAQLHLRGVYRHLLEDARVEVLPVRVLALWSSMHDTGKVHVRMSHDGCAEIQLVGYGVKAIEMCKTTSGYIAEIFRFAGAKDVRLRHTACEVHGDDLCAWKVTWTTPDPA
jgi:hypothetical protein